MNRLQSLVSQLPNQLRSNTDAMAQTYKTVVLNQRPKDDIVIGETFKTVTKDLPKEADLQDGQVLLQTIYLSLDPAMRGWIEDKRSYLPPVQIGETMRSFGVCKVVASKSANLAVGDHVTSLSGWAEYAVVSDKDARKIDNIPGLKLTDRLGVLGFTGMTAYFGLLDIGDPKPGELVVVSGAAGATGSVVCQIAKIKGARVVAIAGSEDKCDWLREIGCDVALNYKAADFEQQFDKATEGYIDVYFDNVGGKILDMALKQAKEFSRFVMCGGISTYNDSEATGPKNIMRVVAMRIKMQGFIVTDFIPRFGPAQKEMGGWLAQGKLQRREHVVRDDIDKAPDTLNLLFAGANTGKMILAIRDE